MTLELVPLDHIVEGCQCKGKKCTLCEQSLCILCFSPKQSQCKPCRNKRLNERYYNNLEAEQARQRANYHKHKGKYKEKRNAQPELMRTRRRAKYLKHRTEVLAQQKAYRQANPEKVRMRKHSEYQRHAGTYYARARKHIQAHPERSPRYLRTYRSKHPDKAIAWKQNRRTRITQSGGQFTEQEWQALKAHYDYTCLCCGRCEPEIKLCADHVIPVTKGGSSNIDNIQPLCKSCNSKKHNKIIDYRRLAS